MFNLTIVQTSIGNPPVLNNLPDVNAKAVIRPDTIQQHMQGQLICPTYMDQSRVIVLPITVNAAVGV